MGGIEIEEKEAEVNQKAPSPGPQSQIAAVRDSFPAIPPKPGPSAAPPNPSKPPNSRSQSVLDFLAAFDLIVTFGEPNARVWRARVTTNRQNRQAGQREHATPKPWLLGD
jgi:hypothetical protein